MLTTDRYSLSLHDALPIWACYVTPAHQFPLGGRMPVHRRADLLAWATASGALVLEDDYDGEVRYDVAPLNPLRSMPRSEEHTSELQSHVNLVCRLLLGKKK